MQPLPLRRCLARVPWRRQTLADDEVHVWQLDPAQARSHVDALGQLLTPDELDRANCFYHIADRQRYVVTRGLLRLLIEAYGIAAADEIRFAYSVHGKPRLAEIHRADGLHFNLSHTHGKSVLAFARCAVGVDVERCVDPGDLDKLAASCFSAHELAEYRSLASDARLRGFYNGWTRKEAYLKATGEGLQRPLASFSVSLTPGGDPRLLEIDGDPHLASAWAMRDLTPRESLDAFVLSLAIRAPQARITSRCWETLT